MARVLITNVIDAVRAGADDTEINALIEQHLADFEIDSTVENWRTAKYAVLRASAYPPMQDYMDAQVKIAAGGEWLVDGQAQLDGYNQACLAVKLRFPKPEV